LDTLLVEVNNMSFHMFPDSGAALGEGHKEEPPTNEAVAFANVLHWLHR
jgi:hypothetical protein